MIEIDLQPDADVVIIRLRGIQSRGEFEDLASALDSPASARANAGPV